MRRVCAALSVLCVAAGAARAADDDFSPPRESGSVTVAYPPEARAAGAGGVVVLFADVEPDGAVGTVRVLRSAGHPLDDAAVTAARALRFEPARAAGTARRWRVEVRFTFDAAAGEARYAVVALGRDDWDPAESDAASRPASAAPPGGAGAGGGAPATAPAGPPESAGAAPPPAAWDDRPTMPGMVPTHGRVSVPGPLAPGSPGLMRWRLFAADPADWPREVPGLVLVRLPGAGRAPLYSVRGAPLEEGGSLAVSVDGVPVNLPGAALGPGYADLAFLPPELVGRVELDRGPFDPRDGDFATAGALRVTTLEHLDRSIASLSLSYPPFRSTGAGMLRALAMVEPSLPAGVSALIGAEGFIDGGYTDNSGSNRYSLFARARAGGFSATATSYAASWGSPGLVPQNGLPGAAGEAARFAAFDDSDGGAASRHALALRYDGTKPGTAGATGVGITAWVAATRLTLWEDRTGFLFDACAGGACLGDQLEHDDRRAGGGMLARGYTAGRLVSGIRFRAELGIDARFAAIDLERWHSTRRERLCAGAGACDAAGSWRIGTSDLSAYARGELHFWKGAIAGVALRSTYLLYDVEDRAENTTVPGGPTSGTAAFGLAAPNAWLILLPHRALEVFARAGIGTRAPDPRVTTIVATTLPAALPARTFAGEAGVRLRPLEEVDVLAAAFGATWDAQTYYDPVAGAAAVSPAGERYGGDVVARYRIRRWLSADLAVTATWGRLRPDGADPTPLAPDGLPVLTGWLGAVAEHPSGMGAMVRARYLGPRVIDAATGARGRGALVVDAALALQRGSFGALLAVENVLASAYDEAQLWYTSRPDPAGAAAADRHYTPGQPLTATASVEVRF
ncbi:MAG TPA: TonB family protein [Myxococcota bacterium]|jgi:TonB family protein|nr:TonB family protein [Myxococcota bacterium]